MSNTKHTPGPWALQVLPRIIDVMDANRYGVAKLSCIGGEESEMLANARLIAAAPDAYEFAQYVAKYICASRIEEIRDMAKAFIAKAEGRE